MNNQQLSRIELYTDGACSVNPGPGGWAFIVRYSNGVEKIDSGGKKDTTNNIMELMAVVQGVQSLNEKHYIRLFTDSMYVGDGIIKWRHSWKRNGWKRRDGQQIKNLELWKLLDDLLSGHMIAFTHVHGHSGHIENERCDRLAVAATQPYKV